MATFKSFKDWLRLKMVETVGQNPAAAKLPPKDQQAAIDASKDALMNKVKTSGGMKTGPDILQNPSDVVDVAGDAAKNLAQKGNADAADIQTTMSTVMQQNNKPGQPATMKKRMLK